MVKFRIGRLPLIKGDKKTKEFKLQLCSIEVDTFFKCACVILFNFEIEINW